MIEVERLVRVVGLSYCRGDLSVLVVDVREAVQEASAYVYAEMHDGWKSDSDAYEGQGVNLENIQALGVYLCISR